MILIEAHLSGIPLPGNNFQLLNLWWKTKRWHFVIFCQTSSITNPGTKQRQWQDVKLYWQLKSAAHKNFP
jgi:hypothetical protein